MGLELNNGPPSPLVPGLVHGSASLLTEMELSDSERSLNASRRPFSEIEEEDDVECDNPDPVSMTEATGEIKEVCDSITYVLDLYLVPNSINFPGHIQGVLCPRRLGFVDVDLGCSTTLLGQ